ncbi:hypothetical protein EG68_05246 [Paragonimus skrjabini miyazakii]|uniref:Uncharacterized protein n=1 Tax=Paragonimus skrjabini miyazakii TaxID=59628 RepID=A0A8S9YRD2_9TREM|nr:hypothetical protein EG68_05246 [Paragonimus skrjabini miyazakii]
MKTCATLRKENMRSNIRDIVCYRSLKRRLQSMEMPILRPSYVPRLRTDDNRRASKPEATATTHRAKRNNTKNKKTTQMSTSITENKQKLQTGLPSYLEKSHSMSPFTWEHLVYSDWTSEQTNYSLVSTSSSPLIQFRDSVNSECFSSSPQCSQCSYCKEMTCYGKNSCWTEVDWDCASQTSEPNTGNYYSGEDAYGRQTKPWTMSRELKYRQLSPSPHWQQRPMSAPPFAVQEWRF